MGLAQARPVEGIGQAIRLDAVDQQVAHPTDPAIGLERLHGAVVAQGLGQRIARALGQCGGRLGLHRHGHSQRLRRL